MTVNTIRDPRNSKPIGFRTYPALKKRFEGLMVKYRYHASQGEISPEIIPNPGQAMTDFLAAKVEEWEAELEIALLEHEKQKEVVK